MDKKPDNQVPAEWAEVLAESEADLAAGHIVSGDIVRQELRDSIAALEAKLSNARAPDLNLHR